MLNLPFFRELQQAKNILIAGAGGGFDIFSGLPLYLGLKSEGKTVYLANFSFTNLPNAVCDNDEQITPTLWKVVADGTTQTEYFPEKYLAKWFHQNGLSVPIFCFQRSGLKQLKANYQELVVRLNVDTIILVDGGTDSLMRGDESSLGTPEEDILSILASNQTKVPRKIMVCLGFGVDHYHGINHEYFLEAVAELTRANAYLGMFSLTADMPEVRQYKEATEFVFESMPTHMSIVSNSVLTALKGEYGNIPIPKKRKTGTVWINPLMPVYWCFSLPPVAERILYAKFLEETNEFLEVVMIVENWRKTLKNIRPKQNIPV
jgi:hypothetical protein